MLWASQLRAQIQRNWPSPRNSTWRHVLEHRRARRPAWARGRKPKKDPTQQANNIIRGFQKGKKKHHQSSEIRSNATVPRPITELPHNFEDPHANPPRRVLGDRHRTAPSPPDSQTPPLFITPSHRQQRRSATSRLCPAAPALPPTSPRLLSTR